MKLLPKSAFGQTVLLIGALLLINQVVSYLSVTLYFIRPSYEQISSLIATQTATLKTQLGTPQPVEFYGALKADTGIEIFSPEQASQQQIHAATPYQFISNRVSQQLGEAAEVRISAPQIGDATLPYYVWVTVETWPQQWIRIPVYGLSESNIFPLTLYLLLIGVLSVSGGWLFVFKLNRPLKALQRAAINVGHGQFPPPLKEEGTSEIIEVTRAFNRMNQGIKQLEQDRLVMTAGISHDLRTPLTRIRLAIEMLPDAQDWIKEGVVNDIEDMNAIIDQFIEYARQVKQEEQEWVDLNSLIAALVETRTGTQHRNKGVNENCDIRLYLQPLPKVALRRIAIKRVLDNIIENAFRYGSHKIDIHSYCDLANKRIVCTLRDYGNGIPAAQLESVFRPFSQGDSARGSGGSGLGLAISKRIIEMHGGDIALHNHPQGGLVAEFYLPVEKQ